ncbi:formylglycine-generating enzyme family protein [Actinoplanes sp. CA-131856]
MEWIPAGKFWMGSDDHYPEEAPARQVSVGGFWIDRYPVTNREFATFVRRTGHVTVAERAADPGDYPGAVPEMLAPSSVVFTSPPHPVDLRDPFQWWTYVPGADWRHPTGPGSSIRRLPDHPVVHVAWEDVMAYSKWAGKELPTEAEWEYAARGGLDRAEFAWGDELNPGGRHWANTWQGDFPVHNTKADGYERTSPVGRFPANGYGLYDMIGNVWEWTADPYGDHRRPCCSVDKSGIARRVMKGGSHLCSPNYCRRYRPAARMAQPVDTGTSHLGFRCVRRTEL